MATEVMKTFSALQEELQKAREGLRSVDSHIKRIIGRDPEQPQTPGQGPPRPGQKRPPNQTEDFYGRGRGSFHIGGGRGRGAPPGRGQDDDGPPGIRRRLGERTGTVFSRLSGPPPKYSKKDDEGLSGPPPKFFKKEEEEEEMEDDDVQFKPAISSRVIAQTRELPSKQDILAAQGDERSKARNRRMFGALLGTLQRFRQEETRMRDREDKRAQVEKKLEEAAKKEKEDMKKEKQELFLDRRRKQQEIRRIEFKIQRVKEQDQWEARHRPLLNFIQTKAKPQIFYLPKVQNIKTEERLVASQKIIAKMMEKKRMAVQEELERLEGNQNKTDNSGEHHFEEDDENMEAENGPSDHADASQPPAGDSPVENKENRLRSINVKIEKDLEEKGPPTGKVVRPEHEEKKDDGEHGGDSNRHPSNHHERREQRDQRDHHDRSRDRQRSEQQHDRDRGKFREQDRERGKERERGRIRERERFRGRERRGDREEKVEVKKEDEEKWDRKRERHNSSDTNANEEDEGNEKSMDTSAVEVPELSSISLPGESSPALRQPSNDEEDEEPME